MLSAEFEADSGVCRSARVLLLAALGFAVSESAQSLGESV